MSDTRTHNYTWDHHDLARVQLARVRLWLRKTGLRYPVFLLLAMLAIGTVFGLPIALSAPGKSWTERLVSTWPALAVWSCVYLLYPTNFLNMIQYRRMIRSMPEDTRAVEWGYDDDGLWMRSARGTGQYQWGMFSRIGEARECFLFYQGEMLTLWLPGKAFSTPEAIADFAATARAHVADSMSVGDCRWSDDHGLAFLLPPESEIEEAGEDDPIVCRYVWDVDALVQAWKGHYASLNRRYPGGWFRKAVLMFLVTILVIMESMVLIAAVTGLDQGKPEVLVFAGVATLVLSSLFAFVYFFLIKRSYLYPAARRHFRTIPRGSQFVEWTFEPTQIQSRTDLATAILFWPYFHQIVETPTAFLLYQTQLFFHWLPGHGFRSEAEMKRFAELARSQVPNFIQLGECRFVGKPRPIETDEF